MGFKDIKYNISVGQIKNIKNQNYSYKQKYAACVKELTFFNKGIFLAHLMSNMLIIFLLLYFCPKPSAVFAGSPNQNKERISNDIFELFGIFKGNLNHFLPGG